MRDLIQDVVWVRALLPFATSQDHCNSFAVLNTDAKTVARVRWREGSVQAPQERRLPVRVQVDPLRGYAADAEKVDQYGEDRALTWNPQLNSADVAYILYQSPVLVAVHAREMLRHA